MLAVFGVLIAHPAGAVEDRKVLACAEMTDKTARLNCFDMLAYSVKSADDAPTPSAPESTGRWTMSRSTNPLDDTTTVVAFLTATQGTSKWGDAVQLYARCRSNVTELYVDWGDYLGHDDYRSETKRVSVRVGQSPAKDQQWSVSTDGKATFAPGWAGDLLKRLVSADQLVLQTVPYSESPTTAVFDLTGARAAIRQVADACGWQLP